MQIGIMQPYFFPYIGYWQLINAVDEFVIYDNIQYTKKGWINRNRFLQNGEACIFSIPLVKDGIEKNVNQRIIAREYDRAKFIARLRNAYCKAPYFQENIDFLEKVINYDTSDLFEYIYNSVQEMCRYLGINTKITVSSTLGIDHSLKSKDKVIAICRNLNANTYINSIGGIELYNHKDFLQNNINLRFIKTGEVQYHQFNNDFVSNLSIIDVLMFNNMETLKTLLGSYILE